MEANAKTQAKRIDWMLICLMVIMIAGYILIYIRINPRGSCSTITTGTAIRCRRFPGVKAVPISEETIPISR